MKKIIAIVLVLCCMLSAVSCNKKKNDENLEKFDDMFASSAPTRAETVVTQKFNNGIELKSVIVLTTGTVDGKIATTLESEVQTLSKIDASTLNYITTTKTTNWYYEGLGTSTDKGKNWKADGTDFAPKSGTLAMNLLEEYMDSITYSSDETSEKIVIKVSAENSAKVLQNFIGEEEFNYDVTITVVSAGERITSVLIEYVVDEHMIGDESNLVEISDVVTTIKVDYSYDIQAVTFE